MSTPTLAPVRIRRLVDGRPPAVSWLPAASRPTALAPSPDQPPLELGDPDQIETAQPAAPGVRGRVVETRWAASPRPDLPDAAAWSTSLVVAVIQVQLAQRPVAQLNRWLAEDVLGAVTRQQRRRRAGADRSVVRVSLRSLRVQHPDPEVAEVAAVVVVGSRPVPVALRLEALGNRWLCTAIELDPRLFR